MAGTIPHRPMVSTPGGATTSTTFDPGYLIPASFMNSFRVTAVAERLARLVRPGQRFDSRQFFNLCVTLARGIDYAVANNEVPARAHELPTLLKQVYQHKNEVLLQAAIMMLMISVKSACKSGWFLVKDADELLNRTNELGMGFCNPGDIITEPSNPPQIISKILSRFYPWMKMSHIFASLEVKPGFGAYLIDFHISKNKASSAREKIRLFAAQTDNIETSSCIISPPRVNFLLNGKGIERRNNVTMDNGPQFPTNVTPMVKYGTNLLQAVGHFNGNYIIAIAFTSEVSSVDIPELQDYVRPLSTALDSDSEIIEEASRISLNCPISFRRIKTPVKGHLCKHHQCFDYENFVKINSRRPSWRCPQCNQSVCYTDLRIDQCMVEVLKEVGENVADVTISADGSWKAHIETDDSTDQQDDTTRNKQDESDQCEPTRFSTSIANVVDLTVEGVDENNAMDISEPEDRKPLKDTVHGTVPLFNNTPEIQNEDDFWSGIFFPSSSAPYESVTPTTRVGPHVVGPISESPLTDVMLAPVLTDAVSPAQNRDPVDARGTTRPSNSIIRRQFSIPENLSLQPLQGGSSIINSEIGRPAIPRNVSRTPIAIQALPAQSQVPNSHQRPRTSLNSLMPNSAPLVTSQTATSTQLFLDVSDIGGETENQQQQLSWSNMNSTPVSEMSPSLMTQSWDHRSHISSQPVQQVVGLPAPSRVPGAYRAYDGPLLNHQNPHNPLSPDTRVSQMMNQPTMARPSTHFPPGWKGGSQIGFGPPSGSQRARLLTQQSSQVARAPPVVPVHLQPPRTGSSSLMAGDGHRAIIGEQRGGNMEAGNQPVPRVDSSIESPSEQNWRPTGRMRGSLSGRAFSAALSQYIIQPSQAAQTTRPPGLGPISPPSASSQLQVLINNSSNAHAPTSPDLMTIDVDMYDTSDLLPNGRES
ncbi:zinc finger protein [Macleaya cordata]|uniref:Zinc finger protein n=1 Tax=Macleaya cordata TaxID=56857 RepID=A0A200R2Q3_MACCD|nr:zinc finger protein [Macleaya cordata]